MRSGEEGDEMSSAVVRRGPERQHTHWQGWGQRSTSSAALLLRALLLRAASAGWMRP